MNRRKALKLGAKLGVVGATGFALGYRFLPSMRSRNLESVDDLARKLYAGLDDDQRKDTCVSYDHPMRQYHNRGVWGGGSSVLGNFSRAQRGIITDLMYAGLSEEGWKRIPREDLTRWSGVNSMRVLICGDPTASPYQIVLTGVHLNLRLGGKSREGAAFGGPQVYGDQHGNGAVGLPGNVFRDQFLLAQRLFKGLDAGRKKLALLPEAPMQTGIELQGRKGTFPGIPVSELTPDGTALAEQLVDRILETYAVDDVAYARECLNANGGTDKLWLSYYQHGEDGDIPEAQVFRLEGPGAVFYFRGSPHVHAFINIAMDGDAPLSSGESLGNNPTWLDRPAVKTLFETALRAKLGADLAYYPQGSVAGRLRAGTIRSGDIYSLESWQENAVVADVRGANLSTELQKQLRDRGQTLDSAKTYKVATSDYGAGEGSDGLGRVDSKTQGAMLRDLLVEYLKANGFDPKGSPPRLGGVSVDASPQTGWSG
jgi:hypothetical protein